MDLNRAFPYKVCINLDRRTDRWEQMRTRFEQHEIYDVRRFSAVDGQQSTVPPSWSSTPGAYGCLLSHLRIVHVARELGEPSVLIFEDDVVFNQNLQEKFSSYIQQLPSDWDMLYFGALHLDDLIDISGNIHRIRRACSTYAYALNRTIYDAFIELHSRFNGPVDVLNQVLQTQHVCYCFMPHLAWVDKHFSDVQDRQKHHWYLRESLVLYGGGMDRLLAVTSLIIAYRNVTNNGTVVHNLLFLLRSYRERLPKLSVIIVEQDVESTIDNVSLPGGCQHFLLRNDGPFNKGLCFNVGMKLSNQNGEVLIFSDSDIFMEEWDIRGNVGMCQQYDGTTGFNSLIELSGTDTVKLQDNRATLTPWFNAARYVRSGKKDAFSQYCMFTRRSIQAVGGWDEQLSKGIEPRLSAKATRELRVFESPNDALLMHHG